MSFSFLGLLAFTGIFSFSAKLRGDWKYGTATAPWFYHENGLWHTYYLGCRQITPKPDCVPSPPYLTCKAEATSLSGPWHKRYDVVAVRPKPGTYYGETACPGWKVGGPAKFRKTSDQ